jgi:hypothetical protein
VVAPEAQRAQQPVKLFGQLTKLPSGQICLAKTTQAIWLSEIAG